MASIMRKDTTGQRIIKQGKIRGLKYEIRIEHGSRTMYGYLAIPYEIKNIDSRSPSYRKDYASGYHEMGWHSSHSFLQGRGRDSSHLSVLWLLDIIRSVVDDIRCVP